MKQKRTEPIPPAPALTRRSLLIRSASAAGTMALSPSLSALFAEQKSRWFKIGVCDWNLGRRGTPDAIRVATEVGLDGVMASFGGPGGKYDLRKPEGCRAYADATAKHGPVICSLGMGVLNGVPYKSDPKAEKWVRDSVGVARALNVKVVLLAFFGRGDIKGDAKGTQEVIRRLREVAPEAEKAGVILGLETWLSAKEHMHIIDSVGSPNVQVYYDLGNSLKKGYDIYREIRELGREHICEFHAKDYAGKLFGHGNVDFWKVRRAIDAIGYSGWVVVEGAQPFGLHKSYRHDANFLKGIFPPKG